MGRELLDKHATRSGASEDASNFKPKHVVVAWYEDRVGDLLSSLASFAPQNSTVSIVCKEKPEVAELSLLSSSRRPVSLTQSVVADSM